MSKWINVKDRLPEVKTVLEGDEFKYFISDWVQCATNDAVLLGSYIFDGEHWFNNSDSQPETRVKFWQPLPEPPG